MEILSLVMILAFGVFHSPAQEKAAGQASPVCLMLQQQKPSTGERHREGVVLRGDEVMGFSHEKTMHHFRLYRDGGAIEADANKAEGTESRDAIRGHFEHIVKLFAAENFSAPMLIHAQNPSGTEEMKRLGNAIQSTLKQSNGHTTHVMILELIRRS